MTAEYFHLAGTCYRLLGDNNKALEYYNKVIAQWPNYSAAGNVAGIIPTVYERMKAEGLIKGQEADKLIIDAYQQVIDKYPDSSAVKAAKNRIQYFKSQAERAKQSGSQNVRPSAFVNSLSTRGGAK